METDRTSLRAMIELLSRTAPDQLAEIGRRHPTADLRADLELGAEAADTDHGAAVEVAAVALRQATKSVDRVKVYVHNRMRLHGRYALTGSLLGAGSSVGVVAAISRDLHTFELLAAAIGFVGSTAALVSQHIESSPHGGVSISEALAQLVRISRDLAEAQGSVEVFQAIRAKTISIKSVIRRANMAVAELRALEIALGIPD
ncbi:MAG: hypothetical protein JWM33_2200 [Caulobacteraceae bacterium]|nr:hypothetical protein [Caulobacteraceae bacterium]